MNLLNYKNPFVQKIAGGLVLSVLILVIWYMGYYSENSKVISDKRSEYEKLQKELSNLKEKAMNLEELREEAASIYLRYKLLEGLLPPERNVPAFIDKVYSAAQEYDLVIKNIRPEKSQKASFYYEDPYTFSIQGTYHDFGQFLSRILNLPIIIIPTNIQYESASAGKVNIDLTLTSYHIDKQKRLEVPEELSQLVENKKQDKGKKQK